MSAVQVLTSGARAAKGSPARSSVIVFIYTQMLDNCHELVRAVLA